MRTSEARGLRALVGWSAALLGALLLTLAIPMTTSAFTATITDSANSAVSKSVFTCADTFAGDRRRSTAYFEFALDEPADAATAADASDAMNSGTYRGSNTKDGVAQKAPAPIACPNDSGDAYRLDGSTSRISTAKQYPSITGTFSVEIWFKTSTLGGKLVGFESTIDDVSPHYDKHLYIDSSGLLVFGIFSNGTHTLASSSTVADGQWHHAVGTMSVKGSALYLDGKRIGTDETVTTAEGYDGYWRIGAGQLGGWPDNPANSSFTGAMRFAAAYPYALNAQEVASAWSIGRPLTRASATATPVATASASPVATETAVPASSAPASSAPSASASSEPTATASQHPEATPIYSTPPQDPDISTSSTTQ